MNLQLATKVLLAARELGVREYCVCAGARNAPLVTVLAQAIGVKIFNFYDERSAAFFALGRIKALHAPVAVVTTSGTAVAELLPAAVESTYGGYPLVLITADRPRHYRGSGAPQSIDQVGIFSKYVETCWDIDSLEEDLPTTLWTRRQPLQINVCFDEPLIQGEIPVLNLEVISLPEVRRFELVAPQIRRIKKPLIIVGGLNGVEDERQAVVNFLRDQQVPIYAEVFSGLRGEPRLKNQTMIIHELVVNQIFELGLCDSVLRIGAVPTLRFWRDLETKFKNIPVYSIANTEWTGLSRRTHHLHGLKNISLFLIEAVGLAELEQISKLNQRSELRLAELCQEFPRCEVALLRILCQSFSGAEKLYLGNSLPIREWDIVEVGRRAMSQIEANRGANGIEGQVSTFLGWAEGSADGSAERSTEVSSTYQEAWAILGDLTTLYDLGGLWMTANLSRQIRRRLLVINNQGGQIFRNMLKGEAFINSHQLSFESWAKMWGWQYLAVEEIDQEFVKNLPADAKNLLIELKPEQSQSDQFWQGYQKK